jgi:hypothetical protein
MKKTETLSPEITDEEITLYEQAAGVLAKKYNVAKVHVYIGLGEDNERIVGYLKEPSYQQKLMAMGKLSTTDPFLAAEEMRGVLTIEEDSDERTFSKSNSCDKYRIGMATTCLTFLEVAANAYKKK